MSRTRVYPMPSTSTADSERPFIVVVDDERRIADTLALILRTKGYAAEPAHDGAAALELCKSKTPDLLLCDVVMPGMNGIELAIAIRRQYQECQVLLFSGQAETLEILEDAKRRGFDFELVAKPIHPEELLARVKELLGPQDVRQNPA